MTRKRPKVGDVFEIPLSNGQKAYGQYVFKDDRMGPLIQVFDLVTEKELPIDGLITALGNARLLFRPVITGLFAAIRAGVWQIVGHMPVRRFVYPKSVSVIHENYEQQGDWFLWDGMRSIRLGSTLP